MIELIINDKKVSVEANTTILEAARSAGIYIPTLCAHKGLTPIGACRVCVVEVEGERKPVASCHVPAQKGMVVKTDTPRLWELRKMMVDLILATHPLECPICDKGGECELQDITHAFGIKEPKYKLDNPKRTRVGANPFLYIDFQRCIQCIRCARYTEEVEGVKAFDYHGSGGYEFEMDRHLERDPEAESIAGVISICPVGSLLNHPMKLHSIRPWELSKTQTTCPHCSDGCQLVLNTAHDEIYRITAPSETDFSQGHPCLRGRFGYGFVHHPSRLKSPSIRVDGVQKEVGWDYALTFAASKIKEIKESYGPEAVRGLPSPRLTNEEHLAFASFFSAIGGKIALSEGIGNSALNGVRDVMGEGYLRPLSLIDESDLIVVIGADLTETNPFLANMVSRTARLRESRAVVINPRKIELSKSAWRWAAPRPGTEAALLTWMGKRSAELKHGNVPDWIKGIDEKQLETVTGVSNKLVEDIAHALSKAERPCIIVGDDISYGDNRHMGMAAANILILSGKSGSDMAGVFPVLNESNSWGAVSVHKGAQDRKALFEAINGGKVKALYISGEDPAGDWPAGWEEALNSLELLIVQDSNRTKTTDAAHVVLPSLAFAEADGTYSDRAGGAREIKATLKPLGIARQGEEIISELAEKTGVKLQPMRVSGSSHRQGDIGAKPQQVPVSPALEPNKDRPFLLLTGRRLYGSYSLFEKCKPLHDAAPEAILEINPSDAAKLQIKNGYKVKVTSDAGSVEAKVSIKDTVLSGNVYMPVHPVNGSQKLVSPSGAPCFVKIEAVL